MKYEVKKNTTNNFRYITWSGIAPSRYKYPVSSHLVAGMPVIIEARRLTHVDEITVVLFPSPFGSKCGGGELLKRLPAGDIKQGEWDRIYEKAQEAL